jgi:hypothetical protein
LAGGLFQQAARRTALVGLERGGKNRGSMQLRVRLTVASVALLLAAAPASAQFGTPGLSDPATGETYHVEVGGYFWNPTPTVLITSESLGIIGSEIDFVEDLGIENNTFKQLKVVLRPGRKHKLRFEYTPISYEATATLRRDIVFNGQRFSVTLPVLTELDWKAMRFGYEYDFIYRDRGFFGVLLDVKNTRVEASLQNALIGREFVSAQAPIPAIGGVGRFYFVPNASITAEFSAFKLPDVEEDYKGRYYDFDIYGTVNFTDNFGAQLGYRSLTVFYQVETDAGDLKMKGLYFGGVARF